MRKGRGDGEPEVTPPSGIAAIGQVSDRLDAEHPDDRAEGQPAGAPLLPLAKRRPAPPGPFATLLAAAAEHPRAAEGLALAYAALGRPQRHSLIEAVLTDARAAGVNAPAVLASLLAVEQDVELAREIASAISASGGAGLRCDADCQALLAGDAIEGAALLARPLHGRFVEILGLAWTRDRGVVDIVFEPLSTRDALLQHRRKLAPEADLEPSPAPYAVDVIAAALWEHRRVHGALPELVARFADLFDPSLRRSDPDEPQAAPGSTRA